MKRFFTFAVLTLLVAVGANAQSLRKTWDFRQGFSTKTVNALKADQEEFGPNAHWRNYEGDATKADEQHFWCAAKGSAISDENGNACTFSGDRATIIPELEGLSVSSITNAKKFSSDTAMPKFSGGLNSRAMTEKMVKNPAGIVISRNAHTI